MPFLVWRFRDFIFFFMHVFQRTKKILFETDFFYLWGSKNQPKHTPQWLWGRISSWEGSFPWFWRLSIAFLGLSGGIVLTIMVYLTHFTLVPSFLFYVYWHLNKTLVFHMSSFRLGIAPLCKRNRWNQSSYTNAKQH